MIFFCDVVQADDNQNAYKPSTIGLEQDGGNILRTGKRESVDTFDMDLLLLSRHESSGG